MISLYIMLVIDNVIRFDSGRYNLILENNSGFKIVFVNVRVFDLLSVFVNLSVRDVKKDSVILFWELLFMDGGVKVINYIVEKREIIRKVYVIVINNCIKIIFKIENL